MSDHILLKVKTLERLRKALLRHKKGFHNALFRQCGTGLTEQQFDGVVQVLVDNGFCTCVVGERGAVIIALSEGSTP